MRVSHDELVARLDLPAKVALLTGASAFSLAGHRGLGLGEVRLSDGPAGVRGPRFSAGPVAARLPNATLLGSTWSEQAAGGIGRLLAEEARAQRIHVVLGPTISLHRSPLGGRVFEAFSEDPLLTGRLAAAYVQGMQERGVAACLKPLVANDSETERTTMSAAVDEATLREFYLLPFEIAVKTGGAWSVMAAYNRVNGIPATEHRHVITEILKEEWGFDGLVMSDWGATRTAAPAANAGLDLVMPGPDGPWGDALVDAVQAGEVAEAVVDDHVRRLLLLADRVGALGTGPEPAPGSPELPAPGSAVRAGQLTRLAAQGMTVLTNKDSTLPLAAGQVVGLVGRHALETIAMGAGSAQVRPPYQVSVATGVGARLGDALQVCDGLEVRRRPQAASADLLSDPDTGDPGVNVVLLAEDGRVLEARHGAAAATMVGFDDDFGLPVRTVRFRGRIQQSGPVEVGGLGAGRWTLHAGEQEVEFDVDDAAATAPMVAPPHHIVRAELRAGDVVDGTVVLPVAGPGAGPGLFGLVTRPVPRDTAEVLADAARAAARTDVAVVVVGLTEEQEIESLDKDTLALPGEQDALVRIVAAAARRTVVVVNAATPVLMPWLDSVDAVLWAGLPGQEAGHAVAAALLGEVEPAGRLVSTFPARDGASPAWSVTPHHGELRYSEGAFVGYRGHWAGLAPPPALLVRPRARLRSVDVLARATGVRDPGTRGRVDRHQHRLAAQP